MTTDHFRTTYTVLDCFLVAVVDALMVYSQMQYGHQMTACQCMALLSILCESDTAIIILVHIAIYCNLVAAYCGATLLTFAAKGSTPFGNDKFADRLTCSRNSSISRINCCSSSRRRCFQSAADSTIGTCCT